MIIYRGGGFTGIWRQFGMVAATVAKPRRKPPSSRKERKRMGIEPTMPLLAQSIIGFEDRGRHQSDARFHRGNYLEIAGPPTDSPRVRHLLRGE